MGAQPDRPGHERLDLAAAVKLMMTEGRTLLPGVQALFGFQLIAAFNPRFDEALGPAEKGLHLLALAFAVVAGGLIMAPAAYNRQTDPHDVSEHLLKVGSRLLSASLPLIGAALCLDSYLVARVITGSVPAAAGLAVGLGAVLAVLWGLLPRNKRLRDWLGG